MKGYVILLFLDIIAVVSIYFGSNQLEGQNRTCIVWMKIRLVHYLMEVLSLYWTLKDIGFFDKVEMDEKEKLLEIQQHKKGR